MAKNINAENIQGQFIDDISIEVTEYLYCDTDDALDTIGDTRKSTIAGVITEQTCTLGNATKGAGTWVTTQVMITKSLVDNNMQYTGEVPTTAGAFIALETGKSGIGRIIIGNNQEFAYFGFTTAAAVTLQMNSTNVTTDKTDANLVIHDGGSIVYIVNELGSTLIATLIVNYDL